MPPGPLPADQSKRARRNAPTVETTELAAPKRTRKPQLPKRSLHAETRRWWRGWIESPQAALFSVTDWNRLRLLALLVDAYVREPSPALLAEIRQNEAKFGATPEDRLRLRWRFRDADRDDDRGVPARSRHDAGKVPAKRRPSRSRKDPRLELVK